MYMHIIYTHVYARYTSVYFRIFKTMHTVKISVRVWMCLP